MTVDDGGRSIRAHYDVVVVGGGHNSLVGAAYLAAAGRSVLVCEAAGHLGGASVSQRVFDGVDVSLSRYAYLVSLLPDAVVRELGLRVELAPRQVASHTVGTTPGEAGLTVWRDAARGRDAFAAAGLAGRWQSWCDLQAQLAEMARAVAPTLYEPLVSRGELVARGGPLLARLCDEPVGAVLSDLLGGDDTLVGIAGTDALIGTGASLWDAPGAATACFLYHVVGNGDGVWRVPVGGMGALVRELERVCHAGGVHLATSVPVASVEADGTAAEVVLADGRTVDCDAVLFGVAPAVADRLCGRVPRPVADGCQVKVNMVLRSLPALRDGTPGEVAFAGTLHVDERAGQLEAAWSQARAGQVPDTVPLEAYCHTLADRTILGAGPAAAGWHTVTVFALHTPASLFDPTAGDPQRNDTLRAELGGRVLDSLDRHLATPLDELLVRDAHGAPCVEVHTPLDLERDVALPRGNIFHGALSMPWADDDQPEGSWGVSPWRGAPANLLVCGAGSARGGGVSGLGGRAAARAVLDGGLA